METIISAAAAVAVCAAAYLAATSFLRGNGYRAKLSSVTAVVSASGGGETLEQAVRYLISAGVPRVAIADLGLSAEGRAIAEILAADGRVILCAPEDLPAIITEDVKWTEIGSTYK